MVNGRGWICIALVIFASWKPGKALLGALLFGAFDALQVRMQTEVGAKVPSQVFLAAPYVLSIVALVIAARRAEYPRALLTPFGLKGKDRSKLCLIFWLKTLLCPMERKVLI